MARQLRFVYPDAVYHVMARGDGGKNCFSRILIICCFSIGSMVLARGMAGGLMLGFSCRITFIYFLKLDQIVEKRTNHNKTMQNNRKNVTMRGLVSLFTDNLVTSEVSAEEFRQRCGME